MKQHKKINVQAGQGMVEYIVVLVFGVMVLTVGPGGDILLDFLGVLNDNYQGYSYSASLSTLPDHDNFALYAVDTLAIESEIAALGNISINGALADAVPEIPTASDVIAEGLSNVLSF
tara:strand:+ start:6036 stop:6389 length:354 start_codon:yes stop_codon:yes gene_type:complete